MSANDSARWLLANIIVMQITRTQILYQLNRWRQVAVSVKVANAIVTFFVALPVRGLSVLIIQVYDCAFISTAVTVVKCTHVYTSETWKVQRFCILVQITVGQRTLWYVT